MPLFRRAQRPGPTSALRRRPRYSPVASPAGGGAKNAKNPRQVRSRSTERRPVRATAYSGVPALGTPRSSSGHVPLGMSRQCGPSRNSRGRPTMPTTPTAVVPSRRQVNAAAARATSSRSPPQIYKSPQHFPSRDNTHFNFASAANENARHSNNISMNNPHPSPMTSVAVPPPRGRGRQQQQQQQRGQRPGIQRATSHQMVPRQQPKPRSRSPFSRFSLSPSRRRQPPKQNLTFSIENETFVFEPGSEYEESFYSTDNDGRTQLTTMLGGDPRLSQKVKAHIERKVDEEAAARFEKMTLKERAYVRRLEAEAEMAAAAASRRSKSKSKKNTKRVSSSKKKTPKRDKGRTALYSSGDDEDDDDESQASLGELLQKACAGTGKKNRRYDDDSTEFDSDESNSGSEEEDTEYTMGTMTLIETADKLARKKKKGKGRRSGNKKSGKSKQKRQHSRSSLPKGCKKVLCPTGTLGISIDTTTHGPAIGYIAPKSPLIGLVEVGDTIVSIDGEDVTHFDAEDVMDMLYQRKDSYRKLIVQM